MAWLTLEEARTLWKDAPASDPTLTLYLESVKPALLAYAPALAAGAPIPEAWKLAQYLQARNVYNAGKAAPGTGNGLDNGEYSISVFPLDWTVQQLLRPQRAVGAIL